MSSKITCIGILILWAAVATAQTPHQKATQQKTITHQKTNSKKINKPVANSTISATGTFYNTGNYQAKAGNNNTANYSTLKIADPAIRIFNERANGYDTTVSHSGIIGVPKRAYGIANGHIVFRSSSATSSGTITGSGSVGTGSSPGSMGMGAQVQGVNGKSPYAGPGMWGTKVAGKELRPDLPVIRKIEPEKKE